ncbi:hypothetical protein GCM10023092_23060 [Rurimicrobium arvi]|uniref:Trypsin-like peptidase domain-containing protein n=2 Tax=Rurimicrobium arvi TaxID=2049916 RepID=A0ABP8MVR3_9BACT
MQVKNLKRKIVDPNTYNSEDIDHFDNYLKQGYDDMIDAAISQNAELFKGASLLYPPIHGRMMQSGQLVDCIEVHLSDNDKGKIQEKVSVKLSDGRKVMIPVKVVMGVEAPKALVGQGDQIASSFSSDFAGSICCRIRRGDKKEYLTCSHVFTGGNPINYFGDINDVPGILNGVQKGNFDFSELTSELDVALLRMDDDEDFVYQINPQKERDITIHDIMTTSIRVCRRDGNITEGRITNNCVNNPIPITYENGKVKKMTKLMILSDIGNENDIDTYKTLTKPGDSGCCVYDSSDRPIGMIVAGNNRFSYAVPIVSILKAIQSSIIT